MKNLFLIALLALPLVACKTTAQNDHGKIIVEDGVHNHGDFCPPGQAKKGNC
jgi:hypothetical protein